MQCSLRYLMPVLRSPHFSTSGALETSYFLLAPWTQIFGVFYWPALYTFMAYRALHFPGGVGGFLEVYWLLGIVALFSGVMPFVIWGPLVRRAVEPGWTRRHAWRMGLEYAVYLLYLYPTTIRAFGRLVTRRSGWAKTRRNAEAFTQGPVALDA